jgi:hypothetical protein
MRAFNNNPNYLSETPNITWDSSFVPPNLYDDLGTDLGSLDTKDGLQVQKEMAGESQKLKMEEQMSRESANTMQNIKGKAKETVQDKGNPDKTENFKRKWTGKTSESDLPVVIDITSDNEDATSSEESVPLARRIEYMESIDNVGNTQIPTCRRCIISEMECIPNGWHAACKNCRKARQTCSLSKALPNDDEKAKETARDNEKPDDIEKSKTQTFREIHTSIYTLTKSSILDDRPSIEDKDDVVQLDDVIAKPPPKKMKVSKMAMDGFIPNHPKVRF